MNDRQDETGVARRMGAALGALLLAAMLAGCAAEGAPGKRTAGPAQSAGARPNVVVIVADDLGYGDTGVYGSEIIRTPNIDALAAEGVRFTDAYVTHPVCAPSRAALLTGRYQTRFGYEFNPEARDLQGGMSTRETTIAQMMRDAGYRTGMIGKWHLGQSGPYYPTSRGFDEFFGVAGGGSTYILNPAPGDEIHNPPSADVSVIAREGVPPPSRAARDPAALRARFASARQRFPVTHNGAQVEVPEYLTDRFSSEAVSFIERNHAKPFFLYLAYTAPHTPLQATKQYLDRYRHVEDRGKRVYAAMVSAMDDGIGQVMAALRRAGVDRNTLVVFTSDNGCAGYIAGACSNAPFSGYKGLHLEGGVRVPFIARLPGRLPSGTLDRRMVSMLDILPTSAALAGARQPAAREGRNLMALFDRTPPTADRALFWRAGVTFAMRDGPWKLWIANRAPVGTIPNTNDRDVPEGTPAVISSEGQHVMLYNLDDDPKETRNLAQAQPGRVAAMRRRLAMWDRANVPTQWTSVRQYFDRHDGVVLQLYN